MFNTSQQKEMTTEEIHSHLKEASQSNNVDGMMELLTIPTVRKQINADIHDGHYRKQLIPYSIYKNQTQMNLLLLRFGGSPFVHDGTNNFFDGLKGERTKYFRKAAGGHAMSANDGWIF